MTPIVRSLAYIGFQTPDAGEWQTFGPDILGLEVADTSPDGTVRLRNDDHAWRIAIHPAETNDLAYLGWAVDGPEELDEAVRTLQSAGVDVHTGDGELATLRQVGAVAWFTDPFGFRHELAYGFEIGTPFEPGQPSVTFVTGDGGLGHVVLIVPDLQAATDFYVDTMGFGHSDDIDMGLFVRFLHCNPRHHTLAFSAVTGMVGVHHLMLETSDPNDVGRAYDRVLDAGRDVAMTLGKHTNDEMFSFYVRTPSGFEIEYGSGGRLIDMTQPWTSGRYDAMSYWGHKAGPTPMLPGILKPAEAAS